MTKPLGPEAVIRVHLQLMHLNSSSYGFSITEQDLHELLTAWGVRALSREFWAGPVDRLDHFKPGEFAILPGK